MRPGFWLALVAFALTACGPTLPVGHLFGGKAVPTPEPTQAALLATGVRADDARAAAMAVGDLARLDAAFAGAALAELRAAVAHLRRLGQAVQRRLDARRLVHWSIGAGAAGGVLAISGWSRFVDHGSAAPWIPFLEEWEFQLAWAGGWRVVEAAEVPPGAWWL